MSSGNRIFSLTEEQEESILDISSASSISSMNANRRRSKCNYDGIDILQTMNRHSIEFDQSVYIVNDLLVNTSVESSLFEFSVVYRGALLYSNDASIRYPTVDTNRPQTKSVLYNISSSDDTFELKHLHSIGSKVFYSLVLKRPLHYFVNPQHRYQFKLMAYSPNQPSLYSRAWVQISLRNFNCHSPAFISGNQFSVSEIASPNHIVGVVHAVDEDDDKVFYSQKSKCPLFTFEY
ncbi:hypothetical protein GJ496_006930 [Pomphorhynchus laevis]|nr:hypothetical protein GJ496_006930 [Pomphorhynchus laevis]